MFSSDIGIDLGTASVLVYIKGKGVVLKEPSVVAFDRDTNKIKAIGEEARLMIVCEKIYQDDFEKDSFLDETYEEIYKDGLLHRRYIGKIIGIYKREEEW